MKGIGRLILYYTGITYLRIKIATLDRYLWMRIGEKIHSSLDSYINDKDIEIRRLRNQLEDNRRQINTLKDSEKQLKLELEILLMDEEKIL